MTGFSSVLDPRAIGVTHAVSTLLLSVLLALVAHRARRIEGTAGIRAWAAGGFCAGAGLLLSMGQRDVSPWVSFVLGNTLYTLALSLVVLGVRRFKGAAAGAWIAWLPTLGTAAYCAYFSLVTPSVRARIIGVGLVIGAIALIACRELIQPPRDVLRIPFWFERGTIFARLGGEEFCVIPPGDSRRKPGDLAEAIRARFERDGALRANVGGPATVSAGVAEGAPGQDGLRSAMKAADDALYRAKRAGRNRVVTAA